MIAVDTGKIAASVRAPDLPGLKNRVSGFLSIIRPIFFILTPINAASAVVLAIGGFPPLIKCVLGFLAVAFASCAVNVFNDYIDRERDKTIWPARAIPSGRVGPGAAILVVFVSLSISLSIAWMAFNPPAFFILLLALVLGISYSVYLRDKVGYLALPPIVGLIYLGGWAAFSPETLFSSSLPWYLYLLGVTWQTAHIMVYYPLHLSPEKIQARVKTPPALFFTPSAETAVKIGMVFTVLTLLLGGLLPLVSSLNIFYTVPVAVAGVYALLKGYSFLKNISSREKGLRAFGALSLFRLIISAAILLAVAVTQV